jgi:hypothetical protein
MDARHRIGHGPPSALHQREPRRARRDGQPVRLRHLRGGKKFAHAKGSRRRPPDDARSATRMQAKVPIRLEKMLYAAIIGSMMGPCPAERGPLPETEWRFAKHNAKSAKMSAGRRMKKIEAIIKPFKLDEVKEALQESGSRASPSSRPRALAARRAIPSFIAAPNMWSISCPR